MIIWEPSEWFKRFCKPDLREQCRAAYGDDFVVMYDMVNRGEPIGNLAETKVFLAMVEAVKQGCPVEVGNE